MMPTTGFVGADGQLRGGRWPGAACCRWGPLRVPRLRLLSLGHPARHRAHAEPWGPARGPLPLRTGRPRLPVTGAAGFIGSSVSPGAGPAGGPNRWRPGWSRAATPPTSTASTLSGLRGRPDRWPRGRRGGRGPRAVFHVAALYGVPVPGAVDLLRHQRDGTRNVCGRPATPRCERWSTPRARGPRVHEQPRPGRRRRGVTCRGRSPLRGCTSSRSTWRSTGAGRPPPRGCRWSWSCRTGRRTSPPDTGPRPPENGPRIPQRPHAGHVDTPSNVVDVEDVAQGHVLAPSAAPRAGATSWGQNLTWREVLALLAERPGLPAPPGGFPGSLALAAA